MICHHFAYINTFSLFPLLQVELYCPKFRKVEKTTKNTKVKKSTQDVNNKYIYNNVTCSSCKLWPKNYSFSLKQCKI